MKKSISGVACRGGGRHGGEGEAATKGGRQVRPEDVRGSHPQPVRGSLEVPNANLSGPGSCGELACPVRSADAADVVSEGSGAPEHDMYRCSAGHFAPQKKMADGKSRSKASSSSSSPPQEKVLAQFQQLRQEQRALAAKIAEVEADRNEHK